MVSVKGFTATSLTIGWNPPPEPLSEYVHYYEIRAKENNSSIGTQKEAIHSGDSRNHPYMFDKLKPATLYIFTVSQCCQFLYSVICIVHSLYFVTFRFELVLNLRESAENGLRRSTVLPWTVRLDHLSSRIFLARQITSAVIIIYRSLGIRPK